MSYSDSPATLHARLVEDGNVVVTRLSGQSFAEQPPESRPQNIIMLYMQLNNNVVLRNNQKEEFLKVLRETGTAEIVLPRTNFKFRQV